MLPERYFLFRKRSPILYWQLGMGLPFPATFTLNEHANTHSSISILQKKKEEKIHLKKKIQCLTCIDKLSTNSTKETYFLTEISDIEV